MASTKGRTWEESREILAAATAMDLTGDKADEIYDKWADTYDEDLVTFENSAARQIASKVSQILGEKKDARILDVGAGTGRVGAELYKLGLTNLDAVDASPNMLEKAKEKGVYKNLICARVGPGTLDILNGTYDLLVSVAAFLPGHMDHTCFEELLRITKSGGAIVIAANDYPYTSETEYRKNFWAALTRLEERGQWELKEEGVVEKWRGDCNGVIFVLHRK